MIAAITQVQRGYVISGIKGRDAFAERIIRSLVTHAGFRYRLCDPRSTGKRDLVLW